jgi:anti-sigma factor RsiW
MTMTRSTGTHLTEDELVLHYYGEMADPDEAAAGAHLASCEICRREYLGLQRTLALVDAPDAADVPPGFERTVWARLERDLPRRSPGFMAGLLSPLPLAFAAAVLLLMTGAFFAGRTLAPGPRAESSEASAARRLQEQILLAEVGAHLDRSQMVLVDLVSGAGDGGIDVSLDRGRAEQLVADNRLYRLTAIGPCSCAWARRCGGASRRATSCSG